MMDDDDDDEKWEVDMTTLLPYMQIESAFVNSKKRGGSSVQGNLKK